MTPPTHNIADPSQKLRPTPAFRSLIHPDPWPAPEPTAVTPPPRILETTLAREAPQAPVPATASLVPPPPPPNVVEASPFVYLPATASAVSPVATPATVEKTPAPRATGSLQAPSQDVPSTAPERDGSNTEDTKVPARVEAAQFNLPFEGTRNFTLTEICVDPGVQMRAKLDEDTVKEYAEAMRAGVPFPALIVFAEGAKYRLADGFHRYEAASRAGLECVQAQVKSGGRLEAIKHALQANVAHGRRRTSADKRRGVEVALKEFGQLSDRALAELCAVGNALVSDVRKQVCDSNNSPPRKGRDGKTYPARKSPPKNAPAECSPTNDDPVVNNEANDPGATAALPSGSESDPLAGERGTLPTAGKTVEDTAPIAVSTPVLDAGTVFRLADGTEITATIAEEGEFIPATKARHILDVILKVQSGSINQTLVARHQHLTLAIIQAVNEHAQVFSPLTPRRLLLDLNSADNYLRKLVLWRQPREE